jgi:hypothetical protein
MISRLIFKNACGKTNTTILLQLTWSRKTLADGTRARARVYADPSSSARFQALAATTGQPTATAGLPPSLPLQLGLVLRAPLQLQRR